MDNLAWIYAYHYSLSFYPVIVSAVLEWTPYQISRVLAIAPVLRRAVTGSRVILRNAYKPKNGTPHLSSFRGMTWNGEQIAQADTSRDVDTYARQWQTPPIEQQRPCSAASTPRLPSDPRMPGADVVGVCPSPLPPPPV
ncbi:hypothetical protein MMF83_00028390 [Klebsiella pneumoniae]